MNQNLTEYISTLNVEDVSESRRSILDELVAYIQKSDLPKLNFICTHNSRRSHLSQVWAQTMAAVHDIRIETFSGGTEATAFHPNAVAALERAGYVISKGEGETPRYEVRYDSMVEPMVCYSKVYDAPSNPSEGFAAVMTCSEADAECPIVLGAAARIKLVYEDPKVGDGTPQEAAKYDERCRQIATEMMYVFKQIKS